MHKFRHELLKDLTLGIIWPEEISEKSQNWALGRLCTSIAETPIQKQKPGYSATKNWTKLPIKLSIKIPTLVDFVNLSKYISIYIITHPRALANYNFGNF